MLHECAKQLAENFEDLAEIAAETGAEREAQLDRIEAQCNALGETLERAIRRAEILEEKLGRVEHICESIGITFDHRSHLQGPSPFASRVQAATLDTASVAQVAGADAASSPAHSMDCDPPPTSVTPSSHAENTSSEDLAPHQSVEPAAPATLDALDAPVDEADEAASPSAPVPLNEPASTATPNPIPGVNIIQPTPENSQEVAKAHSNLIPPGAINAAGMRTRSRSRSLPVPSDAAAEMSQSSDSSRGSKNSPRPKKRPLDQEEARGKRQRKS